MLQLVEDPPRFDEERLRTLRLSVGVLVLAFADPFDRLSTASVSPPRPAAGLRGPSPSHSDRPPHHSPSSRISPPPGGLAFGGGRGRHATLRQMFLHRRPLARFRRQEAEPAIYLQLYILEDLGELAASEMPQLRSTQGLLDMMGGGSSAEEEGGPPRKQRRLEETAPGARPAPPEEVAEEIAPTEVDPA